MSCQSNCSSGVSTKHYPLTKSVRCELLLSFYLLWDIHRCSCLTFININVAQKSFLLYLFACVTRKMYDCILQFVEQKNHTTLAKHFFFKFIARRKSFLCTEALLQLANNLQHKTKLASSVGIDKTLRNTKRKK